MMRFYLFKRRDLLEEGFRRSGRYLAMIRRIFKQERIPAVFAYVAMVESNFDPQAISPVKALGLWQFTAPTGRKFGLRLRHPWYDERQDPIASTYAAARFLGYLYDKYGNWELSLAAYNAGEGRINKARRRARARRRSTNYWRLRLPRQTRRYVPSFLALARIMENAAKYGLNLDQRDAPLKQETLELHLSGTLQELARRAGIPHNDMARLNPAWHGWAVSRNPEDRIIVNLPLGTSGRFMLSLWDRPPAPISWLFHTVKEGESITHLAGLYGVTPEAILKMNGLIPIGMLIVGKSLLIPIPSAASQRVTQRNQTGMKAGRDNG
jgi:membrane-bound lytic murein transglycosylase D